MPYVFKTAEQLAREAVEGRALPHGLTDEDVFREINWDVIKRANGKDDPIDQGIVIYDEVGRAVNAVVEAAGGWPPKQ